MYLIHDACLFRLALPCLSPPPPPTSSSSTRYLGTSYATMLPYLLGTSLHGYIATSLLRYRATTLLRT